MGLQNPMEFLCIYYLFLQNVNVLLFFLMQDLFEITVECHSGYKADEHPVRFYWDDICFEIREIEDRWYQGNAGPEFPSAHYFKVCTTDNKTYILKHETKSDRWFLWVRGECMNL